MKKNIIEYNCLGSSFNRILTKTIIIIFVVILNTNYFKSQISVSNIKQSIGLETYSTGNGHGAFYSPYISFNKTKQAYSIGPVIQKCSSKLRGFKIGYSHNLLRDASYKSVKYEKDLVQLNFFSSIQYTNKLPLSSTTLKNEKLIWGDSKQNLDNLLLSTGEVSSGFELYINITNKISWKNYIGGSVYYNFNYSTVLEHQRCAPTLNLGTGICFFLQ